MEFIAEHTDSLPGFAARVAPPEQAVVDSLPSAGQVFGAGSELAHGDTVFHGLHTQTHFITDNAAFGLAVLVCFMAYCVIMYRYRPQVAEVLNAAGNRVNLEKMLDGQNYVLETFLRLASALGLLLIGLAIFRYIDMGSGERIAALFDPLVTAAVGTGVIAVVYLVAGVQAPMLRMAGGITLSRGFTRTLGRLRRIVLATGTITLTPLALVFAAAEGSFAGTLSVMLLIAAGLLCIFLLWKTFLLFTERKISIFYWILYLCAVEIFPITFPVLLALKNA